MVILIKEAHVFQVKMSVNRHLFSKIADISATFSVKTFKNSLKCNQMTRTRTYRMSQNIFGINS
jgi:hypothetical protein